MISVTDLRAGAVYEENGELLQVLSYEHIKMGRGSANIKVKVRNVKTGSTVEKSFINGAAVKDVQLQRRELQFLYKDSENAVFMDQSSFEQHEIPLKVLLGHEYLKEGETAVVQFHDGDPLALMLPPKITLKVVDAPPGVKGDSASNMYKDALLENGVKTRVPLFVDTGDSIVVDTRDGSYTKRA